MFLLSLKTEACLLMLTTVAAFIKPLVKSTRYLNGDIISGAIHLTQMQNGQKGTLTIFKFQMQETEGYTYKEQALLICSWVQAPWSCRID